MDRNGAKNSENSNATITPVAGKSRVYRVRLSLGGRRYITRTVEGLAAARRTARELAANRSELADKQAGITLGSAVARYLQAGRRCWTPKTLQTKQDRLQRRLVGILGADTPLAAITPLQVQTVQDNMLDKLAATTAKQAMVTIKAFFSQATSWQLIADNPCDRLTTIRGAKAQAKAIWQPDQVRQALRDSACPLSVRLALVTGARPEELQALTWQAVDLDAGTLQISKVAYYDTERKTWKVRQGAKTTTSLRTISLDSATLELLRAQERRSGYVLPAHNGGIIPTSSLRAQLDKYAAAANLPHIALYSLRHSSITYLLEAGIPVKAVAARAGHANTATTLAHYAQATDSAAAAAAAAFDL